MEVKKPVYFIKITNYFQTPVYVNVTDFLENNVTQQITVADVSKLVKSLNIDLSAHKIYIT